ncbi:uncharacterized protein TNCV_2918371 [Trichonephila clavipes]|nr:uncharacterized protein TNCV_2918371 [Trichonephila clavipes]
MVQYTIFGRPEVDVQPPDIIQQSDFDVAVSRMTSIDSRETIHCLYSADVNAAKTCYRLLEQPPDSQDWDQKAILRILETAFKEDQKSIYITSADTGHHMGERNVRSDPTLGWEESS